MCVWCDSKMGFKRVMLNRLQIGSENKTLIAEMDENNDGNNDGNRKHTDFSIDKILSDDSSAKSSPTNFTATTAAVDRLYQKVSNDYAYWNWNRRIYPPPISMVHPRRSAFLPTASTVTSATAHYEIMNLSLRMYDQQINLSNVDRIRNTYAWAMPSSPSKLYESQAAFLSNLNNNNNNNSSHRANNNITSLSEANAMQCSSSKFAIYQNLKTYGIDLTNLSELNAQVNSNTATTIKSEPLTLENCGAPNLANLACSVCNKVFENPLILDAHERTHKSPRYTCDECGKGFSQLRNYKYHVSVHKGTKEFAAKCPECDKLFNDKGYLSSHLKIHRNKKEYVCPSCPKSFNQRVAFNMHVRIGVKPHKCVECGKSFSRKMLLKQHLRTHSGEKPYQCSICLKSFADRSNMTLHQRLHSGIKPFACTICPKAFTKKHHLKTHLNYHIGCKPYICPHPNCGKSFTQSSNMRTHSRKCEFKPPEQQ
ncbi:zinc finger protein 81 isoform X1 [Sitodiplosis mosellana]|uniref:zinc finger protein 81 isoform X1 n=1 Tax=Sitodiplosis mosellana TaxID=263140 RepID=UPI00244461B0|nr:zinc finger protein 81 isoform X1 [Sitodiplosis mosellana]